MTSRREFLERAAVAAALASAGCAPRRNVSGESGFPPPTPPHGRGYIDLGRPPDAVQVQDADSLLALARSPDGSWKRGDVAVTLAPQRVGVRMTLEAPRTRVRRVHLRWRGDLGTIRLVMGDAWERGYGDLEWRGWVSDRVLPWYFATHDGVRTSLYGVRTGPRAFCFWQADAHGISLWADVRSGAAPLELGGRALDVCDVVSREGSAGESAWTAVHAFCRTMCPNPRLPSHPVYGSNDWYWAYGRNSAGSVLADAQHIAELSPGGSNRPFAVIDDGWQPVRGSARKGVGTWDRGNEKFPDLPGLVAGVKQAGVRPGIWIRPLQATDDTPDSWRLARDRNIVDPTIPEAGEKVAADMARLVQWGFELIKHDYTTYDLFGRWGFQMGSALTRDGWTFASGSGRTTAEVISDLYARIRAAAGNALVIGCNTVSHLSAGHFEICRVGDDTSGTDWARTRKMGINSLAFRGAQHGAFYVADADCVGVTNHVPWNFNRQWLDLLARSGTMLFVSLAPDALGAVQRRDLTAALALAAEPHPLAEPEDWQRNVYPVQWRMMGGDHMYDWTGLNGAGAPA